MQIVLILILSFALYFIWKYWALIMGAGYDPTPIEVVRKMLRMADVGEKDTVYDLGCGDGRIVVTAAREFGARAVGVEADPIRFLIAYLKVLFLCRDKARIIFGSFMRIPISDATCIALFLFTKGNVMLIPKFKKELSCGTRIVSYMWKIKDWEPVKVDPMNEIYLYQVPDNKQK